MSIDRDSVRITDRTQPPYRYLDLSKLVLGQNFEEHLYRTGKRFSSSYKSSDMSLSKKNEAIEGNSANLL
jgi:hypothetical protein